MKKWIYIGLALGIIFTSCSKEDALTASTLPEKVVNAGYLPQGESEYDNRIMEYYRKYNTVMLYKYDEKEFWWNVTRDLRWTYDSTTNRTTTFFNGVAYTAAPAVEPYVGEQLTLIERKFFTYFPDAFLKAALPTKILLFSNLREIPYSFDGQPTNSNTKFKNALFALYYIGINRGNADVRTMTAAQADSFKLELCYGFIETWCRERGYIAFDDQFFTVSTYKPTTESSMYSEGFLNVLSQESIIDWQSYIKAIVGNSYATLTASGQNGILHPSKDVSGKIRKKYDIMVAHFLRKYGIDLQAIGNDTLY
jgi:hypothetical protein